eukprot:Filipodium_phascolosomae@DN2489_c0_g1_i15.p1
MKQKEEGCKIWCFPSHISRYCKMCNVWKPLLAFSSVDGCLGSGMGFLLHPALLYGRLGFVGILFLQYAFCFLLLATLTQFVKFHIKVCSLLPNLLNFALQLVSDNFTTIENLLLWWLP